MLNLSITHNQKAMLLRNTYRTSKSPCNCIYNSRGLKCGSNLWGLNPYIRGIHLRHKIFEAAYMHTLPSNKLENLLRYATIHDDWQLHGMQQWTRGPGDPGPGTGDPGPGTRNPGTQGSSAVTGDRNATTSQNSWLYHCLEYASHDQLGTNRKTFSE